MLSRRLRLHGTWSTVKLAGSETGGRLAVLEEELPEGPGPPLHSHPEDETYVLLEGEATFWVDADPALGSGIRRGPGAVVFVPGGAPHTYRVESPLLRLLVLSTPAGLEDYVLALGTPDAEAPEPSRERMAAVARELGVVLHGPPPPGRISEGLSAAGVGSLAGVALAITHFTDPACPFAFSAEPQRLRLRWHYGEGLEWRDRMIVLTREEGEAEKLAEGAPGLQRKYGMPIDPAPYPRPASSEPACRAVVAARLNAPEREEAMLRALRVRTMVGGLLDDPALIDAAAADAGIDPGELARRVADEATGVALEDDVAAARSPAPAARALDHKLGGPAGERRYSAPSYEFVGADGATIVVPGFHPVQAYEVAVANLAPELGRRPVPGDVGELLDWAPFPLATVEVMAISGLHESDARAALAQAGEPILAGADFFWRRPF